MDILDPLEGNKRDRLYKYGEKIQMAKIDGNAKNLLWFYAYVYNWTESRRSFHTEESICAFTSMALSTFQTKKKYLESLGWISCIKTGLKDPVLVKPEIGRDDPDYEKMCWAKWHPSNKNGLTLKELSKLSDDELLAISKENGFLEPLSTDDIELKKDIDEDNQRPMGDIW